MVEPNIGRHSGPGLHPYGPSERARPRKLPIVAQGGAFFYLRLHASRARKEGLMLSTSTQNGTNAGIRKPWQGGHGPNCVCSKCEERK